MKKLIAFLFVVLVANQTVFSQDEKKKEKWFDVEGCALCGCMKGHEDLMKNGGFSVHKVSKGMLMVHALNKKELAEMEAVSKEMEKQIAKLQQGQQLPLCGFCNSYGGLIAAGATFEEMKTAAGPATLVTSDDEDLIKKIHAFADRTKEEHEKMRKQKAKK